MKDLFYMSKMQFIQKVKKKFTHASGASMKYAKRTGLLGNVLVIIFYMLATVYYMGPAALNCSDSIYGFGDSTAGPIWRAGIEPAQPIFGGYETVTNFPEGESLYSPVGYATTAQTIPLRILSKIVGPVCAYNSFNIIGYIFTAMIMFKFIQYLTKRKWVALLAGFALSFTPYVQSKVG